jgi:hypothetical protein
MTEAPPAIYRSAVRTSSHPGPPETPRRTNGTASEGGSSIALGGLRASTGSRAADRHLRWVVAISWTRRSRPCLRRKRSFTWTAFEAPSVTAGGSKGGTGRRLRTGMRTQPAADHEDRPLGTAEAMAWDRKHPGSPTAAPDWSMPRSNCPFCMTRWYVYRSPVRHTLHPGTETRIKITTWVTDFRHTRRPQCVRFQEPDRPRTRIPGHPCRGTGRTGGLQAAGGLTDLGSLCPTAAPAACSDAPRQDLHVLVPVARRRQAQAGEHVRHPQAAQSSSTTDRVAATIDTRARAPDQGTAAKIPRIPHTGCHRGG